MRGKRQGAAGMAARIAPEALAADAAVDLQLHTTHSDGEWMPEQLVDYVADAGFALVAITDHDRPDTVAAVQRLGARRDMPVLAATELSAAREGRLLDLLCYGFDPRRNALRALAAATRRGQAANIRATHDALLRDGHRFPDAAAVLPARGGVPRTLADLLALLRGHGYADGAGDALRAAGFRWVTAAPAEVVAAAHRSGAVCLVAHPGRGDGFVALDAPQLARLRAAVPVDGLEVDHPSHTPAQVAFFRDYTASHGLLASAGSDSHGPESQPPIKYPAATSRALLARLGIRVA